MKKISKKTIIIITIIAALVAIGLFIFNKNSSENENSYIVKKQSVSDELIFAGIVDAERRVDLGFASGGRVIKNNAHEGDYVKKGQTIAELDQSAIRAGLTQSYANYQLTKVDTETNIDATDISYDELKKEQDLIVENLRQQYISGDLKAYLIDKNVTKKIQAPVISGNYIGEGGGKYILDVYPSSTNSGYSYRYSGLSSGRGSVEFFQPDALANNGLYIQFNNGSNYRNTEWEIPVPNTRSATYLSRKTSYENALAQRDRILSDAKNNINKLTRKTSSNISYTDARIKNAQAQISANAIRLSDGRIVAPFDGYIVKNDLEIGETVQALSSQITMFESKKKKLILNTPEIYINKIHIGDDVFITLDAYPDDSFKGVITKIDDIDTLADGVPVYQTEVLFSNEDERLRVGMNAHATIIAFTVDNVIAIPKHYIKNENEKNIIFVKNGDNITEKNIELGFEGNNGLVQVISGLSVGQSIIQSK